MNDQMEDLKVDEAPLETVITIYPLFLVIALTCATWGGYALASVSLLHFGLTPTEAFASAVAMGITAMLVMRWLCRLTMEFR